MAYLDSATGTETFRVRREAFCRHAAGLGIDVVATAVSTIDVGAAALAFAQDWAGWSAKGVTAVVCATDTHAYGVLQEARVAGVAVPQDLAVTGFDDLPYSATSNPGLTTVHLPAMEMGRLAGKQLRRAHGRVRKLPFAQLTLERHLVVRGSTRSPGPASDRCGAHQCWRHYCWHGGFTQIQPLNWYLVSAENNLTPEPSDVSEQMLVRLDKRAKLLERGEQAYPVGVAGPTRWRKFGPSTRSWKPTPPRVKLLA